MSPEPNQTTEYLVSRQLWPTKTYRQIALMGFAGLTLELMEQRR